MQKLSAVFLLSAALFSGAATAVESDQPYGHDSDPDACGAALCLLGTTREGDCDKYITKYFSIYRTKHGKFSPSRTAEARGDFLAACKDDEGSSSKANGIWGAIPNGF
ncbi:hypothetical protein GHN41_21175 [Pseudomonas helleri]|uniref:TrbM protein n=1 Tax=Pseudomonas helleri TaxID=1608996 RepID=A0A6G1W961_9PSED|nr:MULTISPECIES: TrbM/KikA/MpfK family conjugal transfer protein [Pseudomonas]MQT27552.1 hypothetical protein [Pseudomonas helleri]MQU18940.1 hypothetical protein [Pseudomonas helleri]PAA33093.1 hypothetical protein CJU79_22960 [Pseudomonas fragi]